MATSARVNLEENVVKQIYWRQNGVVFLVYPFFGSFGGRFLLFIGFRCSFNLVNTLSCENSFFH